MYVVDAAKHTAFLKALEKPHSRSSYVDVWFNGTKIDSLTFDRDGESAYVSVTSRNRERRMLTITARESLWPRLPDTAATADPLSPYGIWLQAFTTIRAGASSYGPFPVFAGKLNRTKRRRRSGMVMVRARDPFFQINKEALEAPRPAPTVDLAAAAKTLLAEVFPYATLTSTATVSATIPEGTVWNAGDGSRGRVLDEIAAALGTELFALPTAVWPNADFMMRPVPGLNGTPDWTVTGTVIEDDEQEQSNDDAVNKWIVTVERPDASTLYVPVPDTDPGSPTRYGGPLGKLPKFFSSPMVTTEAQAFVAGLAKLNRSKGIARSRRLAIIANPALEGGDLLDISVDGEPSEINIVDDFELPLTADSAAMIVACRASGGDEL